MSSTNQRGEKGPEPPPKGNNTAHGSGLHPPHYVAISLMPNNDCLASEVSTEEEGRGAKEDCLSCRWAENKRLLKVMDRCCEKAEAACKGSHPESLPKVKLDQVQCAQCTLKCGAPMGSDEGGCKGRQLTNIAREDV